MLLDTNFLIAAMLDGSPSQLQVDVWLDGDLSLVTNSIAWAEFLCGPLSHEHAGLASAIIEHVEPVTLEDAVMGAEFFNVGGRRKDSLRDCLIAATAIRLGDTLATWNLTDFTRFEPHGLKIWHAPLA